MKNKDLLELYFKEYKNSFLDRSKKFHEEIRRSNKWDSTPDWFNTIFTWLSLYCNINDTQIKKSITDWENDYSIDAIYIPNESSEDNVSIFDFKKNGTLNYKDIKSFIEYIETYILDWKDLPRKGNSELIEKLKELHDYLEKNPNKKIDIIIYREWEISDSTRIHEQNKLMYLKWSYDRIWEIKIISNQQIISLLLEKLWYEGNIYSKDYSKFRLNYSKKNSINIDDNLLIFTVSLFDLLNFILDIDSLNNKLSSNRRYDIFKLNVRKKTDKSKNIREDIIDTVNNNPLKFLSYHNWITITCEAYELLDFQILLKQPQIVNWCQTISWLYDIFKHIIEEYKNILTWEVSSLRNKEDVLDAIRKIEKLKTAQILIKVVVAKQLSEEPKKISKFANSQTEVNHKELVVNNIEQLIISNYLWMNWYNYIKKEWQEIDKTKKNISMDKIYKFMYGYLYLDPSRWKEYLNTVLFKEESLYNSLFPWIFTLEDILKIAEFYKKVYDFKKRNQWVSKYYDDFMVFWLFLIYKEWKIEYDIKPSTIKELLDKFIKEKSEDKDLWIWRDIHFTFFQRKTFEVSDFLIKSLENKYKFTLDKNKFSDYRALFSKIRNTIRRENTKESTIYYKNYNLENINQYLNEKNESWKQFKNLFLIIKDILKDNNWEMDKNDLFAILKLVKKWNINEDYLNKIIQKNNITQNENILSLPSDHD